MLNNLEKECKSSPDRKHHKPSSCRCSSIALEPNENCPVHGYCLENKCSYCGQFISIKRENYAPKT